MSRPPYHQTISFEDGQQRGQPQRSQAPPVPAKGPGKGGAFDSNVPTLGYEEAGYAAGSSHLGFSAAGGDVRRKKSMVRPERERIEPGHRQYYYRERAADENIRVHPSSESRKGSRI